MQKLKKFSKILALLGLIVGVLGFAWASLAPDSGKVHGSWMFVIGFLALSFGVLGTVLFTPSEWFRDHSPWGIKTMAVGFAIAVVASVLGELFLGEGRGTGNVIFYLGSAIMVVGIAIHAKSVFRKFFGKRDDT